MTVVVDRRDPSGRSRPMRSVSRVVRRVSWAGVLVLGGACAAQSSIETRPISNAPVITRLEPAEGPAGEAYPIRLSIHGSGFDPQGNVVRFGSVTIPNVPSVDDGTRMAISVPKVQPSTGEVPPFVLLPGEYSVTVTTSKGTSAPVIFRLLRQPGRYR